MASTSPGVTICQSLPPALISRVPAETSQAATNSRAASGVTTISSTVSSISRTGSSTIMTVGGIPAVVSSSISIGGATKTSGPAHGSSTAPEFLTLGEPALKISLDKAPASLLAELYAAKASCFSDSEAASLTIFFAESTPSSESS